MSRARLRFLECDLIAEFAAPNHDCTDALRSLRGLTLEPCSNLVMVDTANRRMVTGRDARPQMQGLAAAGSPSWQS